MLKWRARHAPQLEALILIEAQLDELARQFGGPMVVALSGGGDSVALAKLAAAWAKPRGIALHAVCVDHGFRAASKSEAIQAIAWAREFGLSGEIVTLPGKPQGGGLQAWAREHRYQALAQIAQKIGAQIILVGHTMDDQLETLLWRLSRQTGLDGLAGMQAIAPCPGSDRIYPCLLGRPMLGVRRSQLRAYLEAEGQAWLEDDSNHNTDYSRVKTRNRLAELSDLGVKFDRLIAIAAAANQLRQAQEDACWALLRHSYFKVAGTCIRVDAPLFLGGHRESALRGLGWMIYGLSSANGISTPEKLATLYHALLAPDFRGKTLAGVSIQRKANNLIFTRARPRRGQGNDALPTHWPVEARIFAISRQSHAFVRTAVAIHAEGGLTSGQ
jgi:tRNA(Ile)-lysidine synthase